MIYRGIVEEVINPQTASVRIPIIHRTPESIEFTPSDRLPRARICTLPNTHPNIRPGDVVVVAFENNDATRPLIIGYLYTGNFTDTSISPTLNSLKVDYSTVLSSDTTIGEVTPDNINALHGINENIQHQLNLLSNRITLLEQTVNIV